MSEETLLTAARRAVRDFRIIMNSHGGLVDRNLEITMLTLEKQVGQEDARQRAAAGKDQNGPEVTD